jgi:hypothetical protein
MIDDLRAFQRAHRKEVLGRRGEAEKKAAQLLFERFATTGAAIFPAAIAALDLTQLSEMWDRAARPRQAPEALRRSRRHAHGPARRDALDASLAGDVRGMGGIDGYGLTPRHSTRHSAMTIAGSKR